MINRILVIPVLLLAAPAFAANPTLSSEDPTCRLDDTTASNVVRFQGSPSYFAKANMDVSRNKIYFKIGPGNVSLDLATGAIRKLPGSIDPVPTPDGRFVTVPGPLTYYDADAVEAGGTTRVHATSLPEVYQSVGLLPGNPSDAPVYRGIADKNPASGGVAFVDTRMTGSGGSASGTDIRSGILCSSIDGAASPVLRLPMISKDGLMLSAYDSTTGTTKIFKVDSSDPSKCQTSSNLGFATGKTEFNAEGDKITFHVDTSTIGEAQWFASPTAGRNMNVFTLDLNTKQINRVSNNTGGNSYYPSFRKDGSVVYLQADANGGYAAVVADPTRGRSMALPSACCSPDEPSFQKTVALGKLWANLCHKLSDTTTAQAVALHTLSLDPAQCRTMVTNYWEQSRASVAASLQNVQGIRGVNPDRIRGLSVNDLLSVCPAVTLARSTPTVIGSANSGSAPPDPASPAPAPAPAEPITIQNMMLQCRGCHGGEMAATSAGNGPLAMFPTDEELRGPIESWLYRNSGNGQTWKKRLKKAIRPGGAMHSQFTSMVPSERDQILIDRQVR